MPAVLPPAQVDVNVNEQCTICGWGNTSKKEFRPAEELQCVDLPVLRTDTCNGIRGYRGAIHSDIMCVGLMKGGKDSCQVKYSIECHCSDVINLNQYLHFEVKKINKIISWLKSHPGACVLCLGLTPGSSSRCSL